MSYTHVLALEALDGAAFAASTMASSDASLGASCAGEGTKLPSPVPSHFALACNCLLCTGLGLVQLCCGEGCGRASGVRSLTWPPGRFSALMAKRKQRKQQVWTAAASAVVDCGSVCGAAECLPGAQAKQQARSKKRQEEARARADAGLQSAPKPKRRRLHEPAEQPAQSTQPRDRFRDRLQEGSLAYFAEVSDRLAGLDDPEEQGLLATSALQEAAKDAEKCCRDAACSRVLERLCASASFEGVADLARALATAELWLNMACK